MLRWSFSYIARSYVNETSHIFFFIQKFFTIPKSLRDATTISEYTFCSFKLLNDFICIFYFTLFHFNKDNPFMVIFI